MSDGYSDLFVTADDKLGAAAREVDKGIVEAAKAGAWIQGDEGDTELTDQLDYEIRAVLRLAKTWRL